MTQNTAIFAANEIQNLFPKSDNKVVYSLGFQRRQKLSSKVYRNAMIALMLEGVGTDLQCHDELINRLSKMTDSEFKAFKTNK